MKFYRDEKINEHLTAIYSLSGEIMYLIEGEDEAILMDTSVGYGSLKELTDQLTDKPLKVLISHGHIDHAMGAPEYIGSADVYMNYNDLEVYKGMQNVEGRMGYVMGNLRDENEKYKSEIDPAVFIPPTDMDFLPLEDGMVFDLGGLHVEAYTLPGHTPGTCVFLIPEERVLILGDACNPFTFMFMGPVTIEEYRENLIAFKEKMEGKFDHIYLCHGMNEVTTKIMDEVIEVCEDIMNGTAEEIPFDFMGTPAYIAKYAEFAKPRSDGKWGNVVYRKDLIFKEK